jgi:hypothetical protein
MLDALPELMECPFPSHRLGVRSSSRTPIVCSISAMAFDTEGCEIESSSAASHAPGFSHRHEDVQVVQLEPTADTVTPSHGSTHGKRLMRVEGS